MLILSDIRISTTCLSFTGFFCLNKALNYIPSPEKYAAEGRHKWRNVICSFIHALIIGIFGTYCFLSNAELRRDLVDGYTPTLERTIAFGGGYFTYDLVDGMLHNSCSKAWPIFAHHVMVIFTCFTILYLRRLYPTIGIAMILEINSIFLHGRQLLLMCGFSKQDLTYRINAYLNILSYVLCRMGSMGFLFVWVLVTEQDVPLIMRKTGPFITATIFIINLVLFYRLIISDFGKTSTSGSKDGVDIMRS